MILSCTVVQRKVYTVLLYMSGLNKIEAQRVKSNPQFRAEAGQKETEHISMISRAYDTNTKKKPKTLPCKLQSVTK